MSDKSEQVRVAAFIEARPGEAAALEAAARSCIEPTRREAGCLDYKLHRDRSNAARFAFIETWESQAALDAHMATPHLKAFLAAVGRLGQGDATIDVLEVIA